MLIPLSLQRGPLHMTTRLDRGSPWHVSALFSTGVESVTLPSRLGSVTAFSNDTLARIADILNLSGSQTISKLQFEVNCQVPDQTAGSSSEVSLQNAVDRRNKSDTAISLSEILDPATSPPKRGASSPARDAVEFGYVEVNRARDPQEIFVSGKIEGEDIGRRFAGKANVLR